MRWKWTSGCCSDHERLFIACVGGEKKMEINRHRFLKAGTLGLAAGVLTSTSPRAIMSTPSLRIALLHLAPIPGDLAHNRRLVETAIATAAGLGAAWIITPELCICGYSFADQIGTEWILPQPDPWDKRHHPGHTSENQHATGWLGGVVEPWGSGSSHLGPAC